MSDGRRAKTQMFALIMRSLIMRSLLRKLEFDRPLSARIAAALCREGGEHYGAGKLSPYDLRPTAIRNPRERGIIDKKQEAGIFSIENPKRSIRERRVLINGL